VFFLWFFICNGCLLRVNFLCVRFIRSAGIFTRKKSSSNFTKASYTFVQVVPSFLCMSFFLQMISTSNEGAAARRTDGVI
jgi:hypothetical protein